MTCRQHFWKNSVMSLQLFQKHFESVTSTSFGEIKDIILKKMEFEARDHKGPIRPIYYTNGLPSLMWRCTSCLSKTV